jgi:hypothetical protein
MFCLRNSTVIYSAPCWCCTCAQTWETFTASINIVQECWVVKIDRKGTQEGWTAGVRGARGQKDGKKGACVWESNSWSWSCVRGNKAAETLPV